MVTAFMKNVSRVRVWRRSGHALPERTARHDTRSEDAQYPWRERMPNQPMLQTSPGAAYSVLRPLCLLSGLAADWHVGLTEASEKK